MVDSPLRILCLKLTYLLIVMLEVLFQTLPIHTSPYQFYAPDIPLVVTMVWVMRRPDVMDPILITIVFIFADMILQRPPGLWALIALCATMFLRLRAMYFKETIFFYFEAVVFIKDYFFGRVIFNCIFNTFINFI